MSLSDEELPVGWAGRVAFADEGRGFAYRPGQVLVGGRRGLEEAQRILPSESLDDIEAVFPERESGQFHLLRIARDPLEVVHELLLEGVVAQPNHVLFAHCGSCCCPHPSARWQGAFHGSPFHASPFHASPFHASPFHASGFEATGRRSSSARPAEAPPRSGSPSSTSSGSATGAPRIAVLDTGLATEEFRPAALRGLTVDQRHGERPDEDGEGRLDPVAGHGTFIAGLLSRLAPGCALVTERVLTTLGEGDEATIASRIDALGATGDLDLLNLSFGAYTVMRPHVLEAAVRRVQAAGTVVVASAGNDSTCHPASPAALPGVVSVGALGPDGPAPFTNHGPWVRACAPGTDVVAPFFDGFDGSSHAPPGELDPDDFSGWARWSGTSFAAPTVVAALAREMVRSGVSAREAVARIIDAPGLLRLPGLGTVVNIQ